MPLTKGQKIQRAMDRIIAKQESSQKQGSGEMATTLPRKKENPLKNTNNPPVA